MSTAVKWIAVRRLLALLETSAGASIVEFAVALPLLVVLVVGIFDFGAAFNLNLDLHGARLLADSNDRSRCQRRASPRQPAF